MADDQEIQPGTVEALLDIVWKLFDDERDRDGSIMLRGVATAGFAGVLIGVTATTAKEALRPDLPNPWRWVALGLFSGAILTLVGVVVYTVLRVLLPRDRPMLGVAEAERYTTFAAVVRPAHVEQGRAMNGLVTALAEARSRNNARATALQRAYVSLVGALVLTSALALMLGLRYTGVIELVENGQSKPKAKAALDATASDHAVRASDTRTDAKRQSAGREQVTENNTPVPTPAPSPPKGDARPTPSPKSPFERPIMQHVTAGRGTSRDRIPRPPRER